MVCVSVCGKIRLSVLFAQLAGTRVGETSETCEAMLHCQKAILAMNPMLFCLCCNKGILKRNQIRQ
eukprot:3806015-Amphidinium_carterae.1